MASSTRGPARRQVIRKILLLLSFIAFPVTINYFSPYLVIQGAYSGIATGSILVFGALFIGSLFFGRLWCGWACPAGGLQDAVLSVRSRRVGRRVGLVKWIIWVPWVTAITVGVWRAGGYKSVDPFYGTVNGISVAGTADRPIIAAYVVYFMVVLLFLGLAVALGRRGGCHSICWMAPFMMLGRWIRNRFAWPSLRLVADSGSCTKCEACTRGCPMSIDVQALVAEGAMEHLDCTLCGTCADGCPARVIRYSFSAGR